MTASRRGPIVTAKYAVRRLDEGYPITRENQQDMVQKLEPQKKLQVHTIEMLERPGNRYFYHLGPRETAAPDNPLDGFSINYLELASGKDFQKHTHRTRIAFFLIIEGAGKVILDGEEVPIQKGDTIFIKPDVTHEFIADPGPLHYIVVARPDILTADPDGTYDVHFPG